jgi:hypothetical protein
MQCPLGTATLNKLVFIELGWGQTGFLTPILHTSHLIKIWVEQ